MRYHLPSSGTAARRRVPLTPSLIGILALALTACQADTHHFTVTVTSGPGVRYSGECVVDGESRAQHALQGNADEELQLDGRRVSCMLQKTVGEGVLRAEIVKDGTLQAYGRTTEPFGTVNVTTF